MRRRKRTRRKAVLQAPLVRACVSGFRSHPQLQPKFTGENGALCRAPRLSRDPWGQGFRVLGLRDVESRANGCAGRSSWRRNRRAGVTGQSMGSQRADGARGPQVGADTSRALCDQSISTRGSAPAPRPARRGPAAPRSQRARARVSN